MIIQCSLKTDRENECKSFLFVWYGGLSLDIPQYSPKLNGEDCFTLNKIFV